MATGVRVVQGVFFVGPGALILLINDPITYRTLGIAYLVIAAVRTVSMFIDKSLVQSNVIMGIILV